MYCFVINGKVPKLEYNFEYDFVEHTGSNYSLSAL